jgi:beta-glucanase (GH16 family)
MIMKYLLMSIVCMATLIACGKTEDYPKKDISFDFEEFEWKLVWEDNFEKDGLPDKDIWSYEVGYLRNSEAQYYTENRLENARVENGNLIIEAKKDNWNGHEITSASLQTYGKKSMLYGKIEVRAKLPTGVGTWPAIWMLGNNIKSGTNWPACGEIDIMENVGFDPDAIHANVHTKAYNHTIGTNKGNKITLEKPSEEFHTYTVEWFENRMEFYVDDTRYFVFNNEHSGSDTWPFDQAYYLIINLAIGGGWGGQQGIDDAIFPQKYYIDYVKVYELED